MDDSGNRLTFPADTVVIATGMRPLEQEREKLRGCKPRIRASWRLCKGRTDKAGNRIRFLRRDIILISNIVLVI